MSMIFIFAAVFLTLSYTNPTYSGETGSKEWSEQTIAELKVEKNRYDEALEKTRNIERARDGLEAKYNSIGKEGEERINTMLPRGIDSVRLIVDIDNIARFYGLTMSNIKVADPKDRGRTSEEVESAPKPGSYSFVNLDFEVEGSYESLANFLKDLGESLRILDVTKVTIESAKPKLIEGQKIGPEELVYKMKIILKAYYLI